MLKNIKNHFMFNEQFLPSDMEMNETAEQALLAANPEARHDEGLSGRSAVLAGMAWEELAAESEDIDTLFAAPLPDTERLLERLESDYEDQDVKDDVEELLELHKEWEDSMELSFPLRFFLQHYFALQIVAEPNEMHRFVIVFDHFFPDDLGLHNSYDVTEEGLMIGGVDKDAVPIGREFFGHVYGEYVYPLQNLGSRILKASVVVSGSVDDAEMLAGIDNVEDLLGGESA